MKSYVGIDLGTTNSAICSYDGANTRVWKSPDQNDVTPSAIFIDRRGNRHVGKRAYDSAPHSPDNAATLFKRHMGTSTPVSLPGAKRTMSPEECSAEILRTLFGYLPEEVRENPDTGTVITVPAAFNQMQKSATTQAAELASIGRVALMQEPVAAVMSVMKARNTDGTFVIFDLGGGTLDVAVAESLGGRINLLAHGGIAMCGGRDFDRALLDNVVKPWLHENFSLPENLTGTDHYKALLRLATWATERAKVELSAREEANISLSETEVRARDLRDEEIYVDIPLARDTLNGLIAEKVNDAVEAARDTLTKAGLTAYDVERIVFVGGPTNYKPLRDKVAFELGISASTDVNPMTAVAEGAALFAESIEWASESRRRKSSRGRVTAEALDLAFAFTARTPAETAKIGVRIRGEAVSGAEFQVDSLDTGWSSGRMALANGATVDVSLPKSGENTFRVSVFDAAGGPIALEDDRITITRTAAVVDAIPASHSIGIEALEKLGGGDSIEWLVRSGDQLPKSGTRSFKAGESLKAGSSGSLNFKLLEGESDEPEDNRFIGVFMVRGADFDDGVIPAGGELQCDFEMNDSGSIKLEVSVPSIGGVFLSDRNYYSRQEGQFDFSSEAARVREEGEHTQHRLESMRAVVDDPLLDEAESKLAEACSLDDDETDTERVQETMESVEGARRMIAKIRKANLRAIREMELEGTVAFFNDHVRRLARPSEETAFDNLVRTARRAIERNDRSFDDHENELKVKNGEILWRDDGSVIGTFNSMVASPHNFSDRARFAKLAELGLRCLESDRIDDLREVVLDLLQIQISSASEVEMAEAANIIRG